MVCARVKKGLRTALKKSVKKADIECNKLQNDEKKTKFDFEITNRFLALRDEPLDKNSIQAEYDTLIESIAVTAKATLGTKPRERHQKWVSERTREILAKKELLHIE